MASDRLSLLLCEADTSMGLVIRTEKIRNSNIVCLEKSRGFLISYEVLFCHPISPYSSWLLDLPVLRVPQGSIRSPHKVFPQRFRRQPLSSPVFPTRIIFQGVRILAKAPGHIRTRSWRVVSGWRWVGPPFRNFCKSAEYYSATAKFDIPCGGGPVHMPNNS